MTCYIEVGDTFEWTEDYKEVSAGDTVLIRSISVNEDGTPWVKILDYADEPDTITADDIHQKVSEGLLRKQ